MGTGAEEVGEVLVIDSQSTDETVEVARSYEAQVVQFHYQGEWPKKRQWAMNTLPLAHELGSAARCRRGVAPRALARNLFRHPKPCD